MSELDRLEAIEQRLAALEAARPTPEPAACVTTEDAIADAERDVLDLLIWQFGRAWMPTPLRAAVQRLAYLKGYDL
ncbi:MAG: hypothetical protein CMO30_24555 [Tistrella sp.]|uniref:Uncharacterized protein n=1 Tax=Tistrella mobilis TaxID=171437 RepID=A0A3B9IDM2_9PROT|nr:hypothetical protein [Tistrella sp.]MAD35476.1 hypothetical protein [Tistrella sp.]MBA78451.1 hypothetical protein [Tistrella sp.]HAE45826.1 hypothetical protein [Tistrella mobilis]